MATLTPAQLTAIQSLLSGKSATQAAQDAGVSRACLYKWFADGEFASELATRQRQLRSAVEARLHGMADDALDALHGATLGQRTSQARVKAATDVLDRLERADIKDYASRLLNHDTPHTNEVDG